MVHLSVSAMYEEDVTDILDKEKIPWRTLSMTRTSQAPTSSVPERAAGRGLMQGIIRTVGGGVVSGIAGALVTAAFSCTVM